MLTVNSLQIKYEILNRIISKNTRKLNKTKYKLKHMKLKIDTT